MTMLFILITCSSILESSSFLYFHYIAIYMCVCVCVCLCVCVCVCVCVCETPMLYCKYFLSYNASIDSKRSNTLALYAFLRRLILHVFNYTIITYRYFNIQSWDKDHSTQHEMAIPIMFECCVTIYTYMYAVWKFIGCCSVVKM